MVAVLEVVVEAVVSSSSNADCSCSGDGSGGSSSRSSGSFAGSGYDDGGGGYSIDRQEAVREFLILQSVLTRRRFAENKLSLTVCMRFNVKTNAGNARGNVVADRK
jgi:hypothetical protein